MNRKWLIMMSVLVTGGMLAGCSGGAATGGTSTAKEPAAGADKTPAKAIKIEVARPGGNLPKPEEDPLKQAIDKKLNVDFNMVMIGGSDYKNQINVRLAAGNYPDVFELEPGEIKSFADKGLLLDLTPYVPKLKPVLDFQGKEDFERGFIGGKQYAIGRDANLPFNTFLIRKDWLDKLGLKAPGTLEEFKAVAKAFTEQDPDGNGKKDTIGLTGFELDTFAPLFGSFGVGSPGNLYLKNDKLTDAMFDPMMKDALTYIKDLMDSGGVDMEYITNKNGLAIEKAYQGKAGIIYTGWQSFLRKDSEVKWKGVNPNAQWVQLASPKGPGGQFDASYDYGKAPQYFVISKAVEKDPAKLQKILDVFNYMASPEGLNLVSYGIEGRHYKLNGGKVEPTELMDTEGGYFSIYQMAGRKELEYLSTRFPYVEKELKFTNEQPRIKILNSYIYNYPAGFNKNDMDRFTKDEIIKFIHGKRPLTEYDQFLATLNSTFKNDAYLEHAAKLLKEKGILK
ncbi:extracellular solute-binding protein [Paenibacillus sp. FSL H8-0034]|uniref:extracellular solute-binding protein n=1 Tax=Paenibacillus sp. FSL H8-0034 TaxID=2954671 RepID=UPI0030FB7422